MQAEALLENLDPEQREAAESLVGPTCILAGAGTGKTRTVTHRIAYGISKGYYSANRVLALTYTNRAAGSFVQDCVNWALARYRSKPSTLQRCRSWNFSGRSLPECQRRLFWNLKPGSFLR